MKILAGVTLRERGPNVDPKWKYAASAATALVGASATLSLPDSTRKKGAFSKTGGGTKCPPWQQRNLGTWLKKMRK